MISDTLKRILPNTVLRALEKVDTDKLCEIRLRSDRAVSVSVSGKYVYLSENGASDDATEAIVLSYEDIKGIVLRACDKSLYAVNDKICMGYLPLRGGIRLGIAGEVVTEYGEAKTIKNFCGLNLRIPHEILGCAEKVMKYLVAPCGYYGTLVVSPPGLGKTTLLRDMARYAASDRRVCNVLIVDERGEIAASENGVPSLRVGQNCDVISGGGKEFSFIRAIRAMRPDVIVTDELCGEGDVAAVVNAVASGVSVFASVHAESCLKLNEKAAFVSLLQSKCFKRYVDISSSRGIGTVEAVYDENLRRIDFGERL